MGLGASGKSSIRSIVFEGKSPSDVKDYQATIGYKRSAKNIIDSPFLIFDCGGQKLFISDFIGKKAKFIFSKVNVLVWVIDAGDTGRVSTSQYYFVNAVTQLRKYSPNAVIYCLFHKMDLFEVDKVNEVMETMKQFFDLGADIEINYRSTSIYDKTIFQVMGEILQFMLLKNTKAQTISEAIQDFITQHKELSGIAIYTEDGLPVFEEGELTDKIVLPANLWLTDYTRISDHFDTDTYKTTLETSDYIFVFQKIKTKEEFILTGIARRVAPLQYVQVQMEQMANLLLSML
ncbi:MAG: ADP-ribosylation factor-like protein [Candidatus Hodarchaeales archaeon]|jgi:GTPase SAR1 family protein